MARTSVSVLEDWRASVVWTEQRWTLRNEGIARDRCGWELYQSDHDWELYWLGRG